VLTLYLRIYILIAYTFVMSFCRHYEYNEEYSKGSALMASLAQSELSVAISLRVEYLRSAVSSASLAMRHPTVVIKHSNTPFSVTASSSSDTPLAPYDLYKDMLDVAIVQQAVYESLISSPLSQVYPAQSHPIIHRVHTQLMTISDIFNLVTQPFKLWDFSLLLLQISKHEDLELMNRLWRSIIYR
jgi:hypothetical protein